MNIEHCIRYLSKLEQTEDLKAVIRLLEQDVKECKEQTATLQEMQRALVNEHKHSCEVEHALIDYRRKLGYLQQGADLYERAHNELQLIAKELANLRNDQLNQQVGQA